MTSGPELGPEQDTAFAALVRPYLRELRLHCYRILGSATDAEDVLQEVLIAAWRGLPQFEGRSSTRTWLYSIATRRCLNARRADRRRPAVPVPPFEVPEPTRRGEITWLQPCPTAWADDDPTVRQGQREDVSLAFVVALQHLPARQLATVVLCDVLDFSSAEVAEILGTSSVAVKGLLQRGRSGLTSRPASHAADAATDELVRRFADAFVARDIEGVVALLAHHATWSMPPAPHEYQGAAAIAGFLEASWGWPGNRSLTLEPSSANGQPAFGCYVGGAWAGLLVLTVGGAHVEAVTRFLDANLWRPFGLPVEKPSTVRA